MNSIDLSNEIIDWQICHNFSIQSLQHFECFPIKTTPYATIMATFAEAFNQHINQACFECSVQYVYLPNKTNFLSEIQFIETKIDLYCKLISLFQKNSFTMEDFFHSLVEFCILNNVSDIHFESKPTIATLRVRIDGFLHKLINFEKAHLASISSYIKLLAKLDLSLARLPQDGRFSIVLHSKTYDFRVSTIPTINGESIVVRILRNDTMQISLNSLGLTSKHHTLLTNLTQASYGLVLVSGPTGSGKTTTLYALLDALNTPNKKIITIEDPVEYKIDNIQQINIHSEIGLDFATILKNVLRQDPDIIMIGEIRDANSLNIALTAALTGHLVLATIHTNNAVLTIDRMLDLGGDPFLISATLRGIIAQRLVRKICPNCYQKGCSSCHATGYMGRQIIIEVLQNSPTLSTLINQKSSSAILEAQAMKEGFVSLYTDGLEYVKNQIITQTDLKVALL